MHETYVLAPKGWSVSLQVTIFNTTCYPGEDEEYKTVKSHKGFTSRKDLHLKLFMDMVPSYFTWAEKSASDDSSFIFVCDLPASIRRFSLARLLYIRV